MSSARLRPDHIDVLRVRLIRETEQALLLGLENPGRVHRIPVVEVGRGGFSPGYAERFWAQTLGIESPASADA
jgi:hypothetical protein